MCVPALSLIVDKFRGRTLNLPFILTLIVVELLGNRVRNLERVFPYHSEPYVWSLNVQTSSSKFPDLNPVCIEKTIDHSRKSEIGTDNGETLGETPNWHNAQLFRRKFKKKERKKKNSDPLITPLKFFAFSLLAIDHATDQHAHIPVDGYFRAIGKEKANDEIGKKKAKKTEKWHVTIWLFITTQNLLHSNFSHFNLKISREPPTRFTNFRFGHSCIWYA